MSKPKRQAISRTVRFEVFKRDKFTCQYCGRKAPDVVLQVDHIKPVAAGGGSEILNLVTSCDVCNGGKGARSLSDDAAVQKQRQSLESLQERREQIEMMLDWQKSLVGLDEVAVNGVSDLYSKLVPGWYLNESGLDMASSLVAAHGLEATIEVLRECAAKYVQTAGGKAREASVEVLIGTWRRTLQWNKRKEQDPTGSELRYIRGILKNRVPYCPYDDALKTLRRAYDAGVSTERLRELAFGARSFSSWQQSIEEAIYDAFGGGEGTAR